MLKMKNRKGLIIVLLPLIVLVILVLIKALDKNQFKTDAKNALELSLDSKNICSIKQFKELISSSEKPGIVDLRSQDDFSKGHLEDAINIPISEILNNRKFDSLKSLGNKVILYSDSISKSAEAWTFLTRMGFKDLRILDVEGQIITDEILDMDSVAAGNEVLKYKFQPDSATRLE